MRQRRFAPVPLRRTFAAEGFEIPDVELSTRQMGGRNGEEVIGPMESHWIGCQSGEAPSTKHQAPGKHQAPSSKRQGNTKLQGPSSRETPIPKSQTKAAPGRLEFVVWGFSGVWSLK